MRNYENSFDRPFDRPDNGNTDWDSLGYDAIKRREAEQRAAEQREAEQAERRYEKMQRSEAIATMRKKAMTLAAAAILTITVIGGVAACGCSTHEIMDTERAKEVEAIYVELVTLMDGPNIRKNPTIPSEEENIIIDFGEQGQKAEVPYRGPGYYYCNEYDPNGGWYGFLAEEFADELFKDAFIDGEEARELLNKDKDGVVWINEKYVEVKEAESAQN